MCYTQMGDLCGSSGYGVHPNPALLIVCRVMACTLTQRTLRFACSLTVPSISNVQLRHLWGK